MDTQPDSATHIRRHGSDLIVAGRTSYTLPGDVSPTTPGAYQTTFTSGLTIGSPGESVPGADLFFRRYDAAGDLIFSTLLGGPGHEQSVHFAVYPEGHQIALFDIIGGSFSAGYERFEGLARAQIQEHLHEAILEPCSMPVPRCVQRDGAAGPKVRPEQ